MRGSSVGVHRGSVSGHEAAGRCSRLKQAGVGIGCDERSLTHAFRRLTLKDGRPNAPARRELRRAKKIEGPCTAVRTSNLGTVSRYKGTYCKRMLQ